MVLSVKAVKKMNYQPFVKTKIKPFKIANTPMMNSRNLHIQNGQSGQMKRSYQRQTMNMSTGLSK